MSSDSSNEAGKPSTPFTRSGRTEETNALPVSTVFGVLADERRRHVLYYLIEDADGTAETSEIADHLGSVLPEPAGTDPDAVLAELHHRHLPKMEDAGLLEYEVSGGTIRYLGDPLVEDCLARVVVADFDGEL